MAFVCYIEESGECPICTSVVTAILIDNEFDDEGKQIYVVVPHADPVYDGKKCPGSDELITEDSIVNQ